MNLPIVVRRLVIVLAASALTAAGGTAAYAEGLIASTDDPARTPVDGELLAISEQLVEIADAKGALGVYYDEDISEFTVVYPSGADRSSATAELSAVADTVRVEDSELDEATIDGITDAVEQGNFHRSADEYVYGTYVDLLDDVVVLETNAPAEVVAPLVEGHGDALEVRFGETAERLRHDPPAPYPGGAAITDDISLCTSGFAVQRGLVRSMVTAGHCFSPGATVYSPLPSPQRWGVFAPLAGFPNPDLGTIVGETYRPAIYIGGVNSHTLANVVGAADPVIGFSNYCFSGQRSGERCGHTVVSLNGTLCDSLGCTTNLAVSHGTQAQRGDSGAPFYGHTAGALPHTVHIRGLVIGGVGTSTYSHRYSTVQAAGFTAVLAP